MADEMMLISIEDAEYFDLFDNIEYKYVKDIIKKGLPIDIRIYVSPVDGNYDNDDHPADADDAVVMFEVHLDTGKYWNVEREFMWKSPYGRKVKGLVILFSILNKF